MIAPLITAGILLYLTIALGLLGWGLNNFWDTSIGTGDRRNKKGAMLILLAPIWPAWILVGLWYYFTKTIPLLVREARG